MKIASSLIVAVAALGIASAFPAAAAETPAVATSNANNPDAPVPGANSFTESQAQSQIESKGFTHVTGLTKDSNGIWRGMAMKHGHNMHVAVDFQGNVTSN